jgi:hypothetical protein
MARMWAKSHGFTDAYGVDSASGFYHRIRQRPPRRDARCARKPIRSATFGTDIILLLCT